MSKIEKKFQREIILASQSPQRIALLKQWGLKFKVCPSNVDENTNLIKPASIVKNLALKKAKNVCEKYHNAIIIASDTIVVLGGKIIGKPKNLSQSKQILKSLNGSVHKVYTGVAIIDTAKNKTLVFYDVAKIKMKKLSDLELSKLFGKHLDKAGSYAVQDKADGFVEKIYGDYFTVVGLPHESLREKLKDFGINIK
jgi:septum formation protein